MTLSLYRVQCTALARRRARRATPARAVHTCTAHLQLCCATPLADDYLFILVLIGDSGVGKSCLLLRFAVRFCLRKKVAAPGALLFCG